MTHRKILRATQTAVTTLAEAVITLSLNILNLQTQFKQQRATMTKQGLATSFQT